MPSPLIIPGTVYKLANNGLAMATLSDATIDQQAMSATATICTPAVDRQSEIIMPDGGDYTDYARNPIVLWGHGFSQIALPIAKSETPDGVLTVKPSKDSIAATSFFTTKTLESQQIFDLIVERIVRATSIHVIPVESVNQVVGGDNVTIYTKWKLLEWSWCDIPCNPEAVRKVLDRGTLAGSPIIESIAKSLRPFAPTASRSVVRVGADLTKPTGARAKTMTPEEQAAADAKAKADADAAAKAAADAAAGAGGGANGAGAGGADDAADDGSASDGNDSPPSVRVASAVHASLSQLVSNLEAAGNQYEDPRAKEYFGGAFMDQCKALLTEVDGLISELGGKPAKSDGGDEPADGESADEAMKTFLAGGVRNRMKVLGVAAPLESLAAAKNLTPAQKLTINTAIDSLKKTVKAAKVDADAAKAKATEAEVAKTTEQFTSLTKTLSDVQKQINELLPANA